KYVFLDNQNIDIKKSVNKIKKHFIFGNKIDYRYLLFAQIWRYCQILDIQIGDLEYLRKTLKFSKKDFKIAKKCVFNLKDIKDKKVLKTFDEFNKFVELSTQYKNKSIKHIGIYANMSSGKSTFVNALLGYDYLPARNEATTACVTSVYDCDFASKALGIAIKENQIYDINDNINANIIDEYNSKVDHIILRADLDNISNLKAILAVHDTPGVNNSLIDAHKVITMDFFSKNKMDMIIYVANAEHLGTDDDKALLNDLKEKILPNSNAKVLFVINKFDCIDTQKENKDEIIAKYKNFLANLGYENPQIYPLSSKAARLFKMAIKDKTNLFSESEIDSFIPFINKFTKRVCLDENNYNQNIKGDIKFEGELVELSRLNLALKNTGLTRLEQDMENILTKD
nr:dynamin family protein [Campylobacter sp.]